MTGRVLLLLLAAGLAGCDRPPPAPPAASTARTTDAEADHDHDRGKMMLADAGPHHAALTAHLSSKDGHELDIFFETTDREPKPVALPVGRFTANATTPDGAIHELAFEPAPAAERKDDPAGLCSHFVAKAGWLKPDEAVEVAARVEVAGRPRTVTWRNFVPKKYAHHED